MKSSIKRKVNGIGLAGRIVSTILIVLMSMACFGLIVGGIALAVMPREAITIGVKSDFDVKLNKTFFGSDFKALAEEQLNEINAKLEVEGNEIVDWNAEDTLTELTVSGSTERMQFDLSRLSGAVFAGLGYCAALLVVFVFLNRLSTAFHRCDTPFDDLVIKRMNVFAWVLVGCAAAASIAESIANSLLERTADLSFALNAADVDSGFGFSFSFGPILIALVVLFLTVVFRYGAQLQRESDETL